MDPLVALRSVREARALADFVVVLVHGGNELLEMPRPGLRDFCRWMIDEGARVVICQHSHCLGTFESYGGGLIVYGQGNFVFDYGAHGPRGLTGVLVKLSVTGPDEFRHEFLPFALRPSGDGLDLLQNGDAEAILRALTERSAILNSEDSLQSYWRDACETRRHEYMSSLLGLGRTLRFVNRRGLLTRLLLSRHDRRAIGNMVRCESHREVLQTLADIDLEREQPQP